MTTDQSEVVKFDLVTRMGGGALDAAILPAVAFVIIGIEVLLSWIPLLGLLVFLVGTVIGCFGLSAYAALRDLGGGQYAPGKMVNKSVIIDIETGDVASDMQCILRNSYYAFLVFFLVLPCFNVLAWPTLMIVSIIDAILIAATPTNQRMGDFLVRTRVIPGGRDSHS